MNDLLTQQDLAKRWRVDVATITNWRKEGVITPCKGIPAIRFTEQHILELEGVELQKVSPLQVRRLERRLKETQRENEKLKGIIARILAETSQVIGM